MTGIYKITNPEGTVYIGQTRNLAKRMLNHRWTKPKTRTLLGKSIRKYGWSSHKYEMIHELPMDVDDSVLDTYEVLFIAQYRTCVKKYPESNGLNLAIGGGGPKSYIVTDETRKKISDNMKANFIPKRGKDHCYYGLKGKEHPAYGHRHDFETKKKISEAQLGDKHNMATKVINITTGEVFGCLKDAAKTTKYTYSAFRAHVNGQVKNNKTGFVYYQNDIKNART